MPRSTPEKRQEFGEVLKEIVKKGNLTAHIVNDALYREISEFIDFQLGVESSATQATVETWFLGKARPGSRQKVLALYNFFRSKAISESSLLVRLLDLCDYPNLRQIVNQDYPHKPTTNRIPVRPAVKRSVLLEKFHATLLDPQQREIGFFLLGVPHWCGSSTLLLQLLQFYQDIYNLTLPTPFDYIAYVDCKSHSPKLSDIYKAIYGAVNQEPSSVDIDDPNYIYSLLDQKALLLALDNVPKIIKPGSPLAHFLLNLGQPHVVIMASDQYVWQKSVVFPVEGFTLEEAEQYAKAKNASLFLDRNSETHMELFHFWMKTTESIPILWDVALNTVLNSAVLNEQNTTHQLGGRIWGTIKDIYTPAWRRLKRRRQKDNAQWEDILKLFQALPGLKEPLNLETIRQKLDLPYGKFTSVIDALRDQFLITQGVDGSYTMAYPFRLFVAMQLEPNQSDD